MNMSIRIEELLQSGLAPAYLEVVNESHQHNVPPGAQSHFKVTVVSNQFGQKNLVARHRQIYELLREPLAGGVHALALHTYSLAEWQARGGGSLDSPRCLGGSANESG